MSIFDKVNKMAKNITEKASEAIEIKKPNTKVGEENRNIQKLKEGDLNSETEPVSSAEVKGITCPACGAGNTDETKICGECGAKLK